MKIQFAAAPLALETLDALPTPDLLAFVGEEERPLRGLAGLVDWRLCGGLTRVLVAGHFNGSPGESLLTVAGGRLPSERIFLVGVGGTRDLARGEPGAWAHAAFQSAARAGATRIATALPVGETAPIAAVGASLVAAARAASVQELILLHPDVRAADRALVVAAETGLRAGA